MVVFRKNFSRCRYTVYLNGVQTGMKTCGVHLALAAPEYKEMNKQVKVTRRTLRIIAHSLMVHARVLEVYINFALMYTTNHIFWVLPIIDLINKDGDTTTPYKLATGKNLKYHIYACYFVHVLYGKLLKTLTKRR